LRSNGIGDFVFAIPALEALRSTYLEAEIIYLGLPWHKEFLTGRPGPIDRVEIVPPVKGVSLADDYQGDLEGPEDFYRRMRSEHFDLAIQLHGGGRYSNPFRKNLGARLTIGLCSSDAVQLDRWIPYTYYQNEVLRCMEVVSLVGAVPVTIEPKIKVTERDLVEAVRILPENASPLVILHPGAGDPRRRWPVEKFAAVGNALAWAGATIAVIGTPPEESITNQLVRMMSVEVLDLCGKMSINGLVGLLSKASLVVSNDSGPLHLAGAVGVPTVGIYWLSNALLSGQTTRILHRPAIAWRVNCPVCGLDSTRSDCGHNVSWVADISQEEVIESAIELLRLTLNPKDEGNSRVLI
jgi:ADP-heptose:LPS heptosyltransferase